MRFDVPVRWDDLDAQGHVNNSVIVDYLQEARVQFLLAGQNAHLLGAGVIVVSHSVDYLAPARASFPVSVDVDVTEVGWSRFVLVYRVRQDGVDIARASSELCLFDFELQRPKRFTHSERQAFLEVASDAEPVLMLPDDPVGADAHEFSFQVRWSDLDSYGHVNNTRFFTYVQEARIAFTTQLAPVAARAGTNGASEYVWLVVHQDLRYLAEIRHRVAPYLVRTVFSGAGRTSVRLAAEIVDPESGLVLAVARTVLVCADSNLRPVPLPADVVAVIPN